MSVRKVLKRVTQLVATCSTISETIGGKKAGKTAGQSCDKDTSDGTAQDAVKESSNADQRHTETCQASKDTGHTSQTGTAIGQHDEGTSETTVQDSVPYIMILLITVLASSIMSLKEMDLKSSLSPNL